MHILIEGIPVKHKDSDVKTMFEAYGKVSDVKMIVSNITKLNRGFAFVIMPNEEEALKAIESLNGTELEDKTLSVVKSSVTADEGIKNALRHGVQKGGGNTKNFSQGKGAPGKGYSGGGGPKATIPKGGSSRGK
jgi:RNA recognition motif-containing protein